MTTTSRSSRTSSPAADSASRAPEASSTKTCMMPSSPEGKPHTPSTLIPARPRASPASARVPGQFARTTVKSFGIEGLLCWPGAPGGVDIIGGLASSAPRTAAYSISRHSRQAPLVRTGLIDGGGVGPTRPMSRDDPAIVSRRDRACRFVHCGPAASAVIAGIVVWIMCRRSRAFGRGLPSKGGPHMRV